MTNIETLRCRLHSSQHCWCCANSEFCNFHTRPFSKAVIPGLDQGSKSSIAFMSTVLLACLWFEFGACRGHKVPGPSQGWRDIEMLWRRLHCCQHSWCYANIEFAAFIHGLSPRPSSLAWTRDLKNTMSSSFPKYCSTRKPLNQVWCMSQA